MNVPVGSFEYNFITNSGWLTYHGKCVINYEYLRIYDFCKTLKASVLISSKNSCNSDLIEQRKCKANNEKLKSRKISPLNYIGPADFRCSFGLYCSSQFSAWFVLWGQHHYFWRTQRPWCLMKIFVLLQIYALGWSA